MAKRKSRNKSFASKRAAEAEVAQRQENIQSAIRNGIIGLVSVAIVGAGLFFLVQYLGTNQAEPEPAAVESGESVADTGSTSQQVEESVEEPVAEEVMDEDTMGEPHSADPVGTLIETDRPMAELDPLERNGFYSAPPEMMIDTSKSYQALLVTDQGEMLINLFDDQAPITVNNFVFLATEGFYDNLIFHRVIQEFMVQGGDPAGVGNGGPGYTFEDEFDPTLRFDRRGLLAMANSGPTTNGSQFFITHVPTEWLNDAHTIFGELVSGDDTLGAIPISGEPDSPAQLIRIDIYEN